MSNLDVSSNRFLCFSLGEEEYAIPLLTVKEVIAIPEITPVPQTPAYFKGIMNLRGQVITVIDLRTKLSIKPLTSNETAIIICDLNSNSVGVVVDSVNSVIHPKPEEISDKPEIHGHKTTDYVQSVVRRDQDLILLLDLSKSLSINDQQNIQKSNQSQIKKVA